MALICASATADLFRNISLVCGGYGISEMQMPIGGTKLRREVFFDLES